MQDEQPQLDYEPPTLIDYGGWAELTKHSDPLSSPSHPALDPQLTSSITPHH